MNGRTVYLNGDFVAESDARVSILDRGFLYGDSVYDSSRTFSGHAWRMRAHIDRLYLSCRYARLDPGMSPDDMQALSEELIERNRMAYKADDEFRINHWITRGGGWSIDPEIANTQHTVCIFTLPMDYERFAHGYADGYPRHPGSGAPILVNGVRTQVVGHCSMDMMTVDLRPVPAAGFGDPVTLWGAELPVEEVARSLHTIPYELLCRVRMRAHYEERDA